MCGIILLSSISPNHTNQGMLSLCSSLQYTKLLAIERTRCKTLRTLMNSELCRIQATDQKILSRLVKSHYSRMQKVAREQRNKCDGQLEVIARCDFEASASRVDRTEMLNKMCDTIEMRSTWKTARLQNWLLDGFLSTLQLHSGGKGQPPVRRQKRTKLSAKATNALKKWFCEHKENPYPTLSEKRTIAKDIDISVEQLSTWFINARARKHT